MFKLVAPHTVLALVVVLLLVCFRVKMHQISILTLFSVVTDPEATGIDIQVGYKRPPVKIETSADMRASLIDNLYHGLMIGRPFLVSLPAARSMSTSAASSSGAFHVGGGTPDPSARRPRTSSSV